MSSQCISGKMRKIENIEDNDDNVMTVVFKSADSDDPDHEQERPPKSRFGSLSSSSMNVILNNDAFGLRPMSSSQRQVENRYVMHEEESQARALLSYGSEVLRCSPFMPEEQREEVQKPKPEPEFYASRTHAIRAASSTSLSTSSTINPSPSPSPSNNNGGGGGASSTFDTSTLLFGLIFLGLFISFMCSTLLWQRWVLERRRRLVLGLPRSPGLLREMGHVFGCVPSVSVQYMQQQQQQGGGGEEGEGEGDTNGHHGFMNGPWNWGLGASTLWQGGAIEYGTAMPGGRRFGSTRQQYYSRSRLWQETPVLQDVYVQTATKSAGYYGAIKDAKEEKLRSLGEELIWQDMRPLSAHALDEDGRPVLNRTRSTVSSRRVSSFRANLSRAPTVSSLSHQRDAGGSTQNSSASPQPSSSSPSSPPPLASSPRSLRLSISSTFSERNRLRLSQHMSDSSDGTMVEAPSRVAVTVLVAMPNPLRPHSPPPPPPTLPSGRSSSVRSRQERERGSGGESSMTTQRRERERRVLDRSLSSTSMAINTTGGTPYCAFGIADVQLAPT